MALPFDIGVRQREYSVTSALPDLPEWSSAESSLSYFQDLMNETSRDDLGIAERGDLYDAIGGVAWGALDMASAHFLRSSWAFDTEGQSLAQKMGVDIDTTAGKFGEQIGQAAGFLFPMGKVAKGLRWGVQGLSRAGSRRVAKDIKDRVGKRLSQEGAVDFTTNTAAKEAGGRSAHKHLFEAIDDSYISRWYGKSRHGSVEGFGQAFKTVAEKNQFIDDVTINMGKNLNKFASDRGLKLTKEASDDITSIFSEYFTDPKKLPVSTISEWITKRFNVDSKLGTAYTHMFEEAVNFAAFEGLLEMVDSVQQERDYDWGVPIHAVQMGHMLGAVRFIPGGRKEAATLFGKQGGFMQMTRMLRNLRPFKGRIDVKNDAHRRGTYKLWNQISNATPFRHNNPAGQSLRELGHNHPLWKSGILQGTPKGSKKVTINNLNSTNVWKILKDGNKKQKEAMATIMRDSLDGIRSQFRKDWFPQFMKEFSTDLAYSLPRMFVGGVTMSGGLGAMFDPNIAFEDKVFGIALGGLMMRRGHEITRRRVTRDAETGATKISFVEPSGIIGGKMQSSYGQNWEALNKEIIGMGGNPYMWGGYRDILNGRGSPHMETVDALPVGDTAMGKRIKGVLENATTKAGNSVITTEKELKTYESKPTDPGSVVRETYEMYIQAARNLVPMETKIKGWENLSSNAKKRVEAELKEQGFRTPEDVMEARIGDNTDIISTAMALNVQSLKEATNEIGIRREADSNGMYRLPVIEPSGDLSNRQLEAIHKYNDYLNLAEITGRVKIDTKEELGSARSIVTNKTEGLNRFVEAMESGHQNFSDFFGFTKQSGYEVFPQDKTFIELIKISNFFENKIKSRELLDMITGNKPVPTQDALRQQKLEQAKTLFRNIYQDGGMFKSNVVTNSKDWRDKNFLDNLGIIAQQEMKVRDLVKGDKPKKFTIPKESVKELREIFKSEGINLFETSGRYTDVLLQQVKNDHMKRTIENSGMWDAKGKKKIPIDDTAMSTVLSLRDTGFLNESMTMMRWGKFEDALANVTSSKGFTWSKLFDAGSKSSIEKLVKDMKAGASKETDTSMITTERMTELSKQWNDYATSLKESPAYPEIKTKKDAMSHIRGDFNYIYNTIQKRVKPLIQDVRNGQKAGFIKINPKDIVQLTPEGIIALKQQMLVRDNLASKTDMAEFVTQLNEISINEGSRLQSFSKYLTKQMTRQSWKDSDSIQIMELAAAHKIWNPIERKFNTKDFDSLSLNDAIRKVMQGMTRGNLESNDVVESAMKRIERDSIENQGAGEVHYKSVTLGSLVKEYDFSEFQFRDGTFIDKGGVKTESQQISDLYFKKYQGNEGDFINDMVAAATFERQNITKEYSGRNDTDTILRKVTKSVLDLTNSVQVPVISTNLSSGSIAQTISNKNTLRRNETLDAITRATGGEPGGMVNFQIVPEKFTDLRDVKVKNPETGEFVTEKRPTTRSLSKREGSAERMSYPNEARMNLKLFEGNKLVLDGKFEKNAAGEPLHAELSRGVLYVPYTQKWGYRINAETKDIQAMAETFQSKLKESKVPKELQDEWFKELFIKTKDGKVEVDHTNLGDAVSAQKWVERVMDTSIGLDMFGKHYVNDKLYALEGAPLGELMRRGALFSNANSNQLRPEVLSEIAKAYDYSGVGAEMIKHAKVFEKLAQGKEKQVIVRDEMKNDQFDLFSEHMREVETLKQSNRMDAKQKGELDAYLKLLREGAERFGENKDSSPSAQDAGTVVREDFFNALASLGNGTRDMQIGGLKAIMLRRGDNFYVNKTALTKNSAYREFFELNPDVAQITFTSGNKKINGKYYGEISTAINEVSAGWETKTDLKRMSIESGDIRLGFQKSMKDKATLSANTFLFVDKGIRGEVYDFYVRKGVKEATDRIAELSKVDNYTEAIAQNKVWNTKDINASSEEWLAESSLAKDKMLADANIIPYFGSHSKAWGNQVKTQLIDKALQPKVDGGQFVSQGIHPLESVRNSIHYYDGNRARIHRLGEVYAPFSLRATPIDKNNVFFMKVRKADNPKHDTGKDLLSWSELKALKLKSYEMSEVQFEGSDTRHFLHDRFAKGDKNVRGVVNSIKLTKKGEWYEAQNIGQLNDRLPEGYQIFTYGKRDPVVGGDSVIPLLLKRDFKRERDGNAGALNKMDGQVSAELDHDIDIVNVWFNGPRSFAKHIIDRKGYVPYGSAPGGNPKSSMDNLKSFDVKSKQDYRGMLNDAAILKGKLMNYSSIIDWLYSYNGGEMPILHGKPGVDATSVSSIHVGKNIFAGLNITPSGRQKILQRLRNDIQGIVDATGGYDRAYYTKWERDFLFDSNDAVFKAYKSVDTPDLKQMKELSEYNLKVPLSGQKLIIDHLITPYRNLRSLTNSKYEGTRAKRIELDDLVRGVRQFDSDLAFADKNAQATARKMGKKDLDNIFNGWNYEARLFNKTDYSEMPIYDRLLASTVNMDFRRHLDFPRHGLRNPWEYADLTQELMLTRDNTDFVNTWNRNFKDLAESQRFIKSLQRDVSSLQKIAAEKQDTNPTLSNAMWKKAKAIQKIINKKYQSNVFKYEEINGKQELVQWDSVKREYVKSKIRDKNFDRLWQGAKDHWREILLKKHIGGKKGDARKEAVREFYKMNKKDKLVKQKLSEKGIVVEAHPNNDMIAALSSHQTFGLLAHSKPYDMTGNMLQKKAIHDAMKTEANRLAVAYSKAHSRWHRGEAPEHSIAQIEKDFQDRLELSYKKFHEQGGETLAMNFLWQYMTPKFDLSKIVMSGGKTYFAPKESRWETRVNTGLQFIARTEMITPDLKQRIFNDYVGNLNRTSLAFHHNKGASDLFQSSTDIMQRNDNGSIQRVNQNGLLDIRNEFKLNPLSYSKEGRMEEILSEVHPNFEGMSATMSYSEMLKMFGSGGLPEILSAHKAFYIPSGAVTDVSRFGWHMATSGYPAFLKAQKQGILGYIRNQKSRTTLDPEGTFEYYGREIGEYGKSKELSETIAEQYSHVLCDKGNGKLK